MGYCLSLYSLFYYCSNSRIDKYYTTISYQFFGSFFFHFVCLFFFPLNVFPLDYLDLLISLFHYLSSCLFY